MKRNVGKIDRILRIVIGVGAIGYAIKAPESMPYREFGWIGVIPLMTALAGVCPLYSLLGMRTCKLETQEAVDARLEAAEQDAEQEDAGDSADDAEGADDGAGREKPEA